MDTEIITIPKNDLNTKEDVNIYLYKYVSQNPILLFVCFYLDYIVYQRICDLNLQIQFDIVKKHIDNHFENIENNMNRLNRII